MNNANSIINTKGYYRCSDSLNSIYLVFYDNGYLRKYNSNLGYSKLETLGKDKFPFWGLYRKIDEDTLLVQTFGGGINGKWDIYETKFFIRSMTEIVALGDLRKKMFNGGTEIVQDKEKTFVFYPSAIKQDSVPRDLLKLME